MISNHIRQLATRKESEGPFLSLYIDTNRHDEAQKDRIRLFLKHEMQKLREELGGNGYSAALEKGIKQIEHFFEADLQPSTRGVVIFSAPQEELFVPIQLPVSVEPELSIGTRPQLRQLTRLREQDRPVAIVLVDAKNARLLTSVFGRTVSEVDIENSELPRRHDQGGWSQSNIQRHVQVQINRHHKEVAEYLGRMVEHGVWSVIISGQDRNVANFREFLAKRVNEMVVGTLHLDVHATHDHVSEAATALLEIERHARLIERLNDVETAAKKHARGSLGFAKTIDAANEKKLETLFLSNDAKARGWHCPSCKTLGEAIPISGCPLCGTSIETVDLVEALIRAAQNEDADIVFADSPVLTKYDGVAAALRF